MTRQDMSRLYITAKPQAFKILVDYSKTLEEMINAGNYDWVNPDITQDHFPIQGSGQKEVEVVLLHYKRDISPDEAIAEIAKAARIEELLALGAIYKLSKPYPIIALGSVWQRLNGDYSIPFLMRVGGERSIDLMDFGWGVRKIHNKSCRFATVCNP